MPLIRISMRSGTSDAYRQAIFDGVSLAMRETFAVPEANQFMTLTEHEASNFRHGRDFLGIERSDDLIYVQITANDTRSLEQKKLLYRRLAEVLGDNPGLRPEDVFVSLVEVPKENWSLGNGLAQYA